MISAINGISNNQISSLYTSRLQNQATTRNSKNKSIVAKTGRNLSEMVLAIKQAKATSAQEKIQSIFQRLAEKKQNSSLNYLF